MSNKTDKEQKDETLPTQNVENQQGLYDSAFAITNELIIVSFYLPNRAEPLIVTGEKIITIGRRDPKRQINPRIDLTEDDGAKLGVSRLHAELNLVNDEYFLKDMGSSNGTWVNKTKLEPYKPHPVKSGDEIRIGQIKIAVHITLPIRAEVVSTLMENRKRHRQFSFNFRSSTYEALVRNDGIIPDILLDVSNYLNQASKIYNIIREAQEHEAIGLQITSINIPIETTDLRVDIGEGADIMSFLAKKLTPFIAVLDGKKEGEARQTASLERYPEPLEKIADYALQELVLKFFDDDVRDAYVKRLKEHFDALIATNLEIEPVS